MKKQRGKKKTKNKLSQGIIVPTKHEKIGNLNNYSEEVAKEIIGKLISLSITQILKNKIYSKISNFCFESVKHFLNLTVSISFINHDRDNIYDMENIVDGENYLNTDENRYKVKNHNRCNKLRYKNIEDNLFEYAKINTEFKKEMELKNKDIDDFLNKSLFCESTVNKKKKLVSNFWGKINQPTTHGQLRYIPNSNALNKEILILDKKDVQKNKQRKTINTPKKNRYSMYSSKYSKKFSVSSFKDTSSILNRNSLNENLIKKEKRYLILEMDKMKRIENEKSKREEESDEIKELRKLELEKIRLLKEEQEKLKKNKKLNSQDNIKFEYNIDTINLTNAEKAKNITIQRRIIEEQIRRGNFTIDFNNNLILVRQVHPENLEKDFPEPILKPKKSDKDNLEENDEIQNLSNINSEEKIAARNSLDDNTINSVANYFNYKYGWKITPSGSSFKLIKPEVGVTLYEDGEMKTGGNEFFEKYQRFSKKDYNKMLKDITEQQQALIKKQREIELIKETSEKNTSSKNKMNESQEIAKIKKDLFAKKIKQIKTKFLRTKHQLHKSNSEIFASDKISLYQTLLVHDDKKDDNIFDNFKKNKNLFTYRINRHNLFFKKNKIIENKKENKTLQVLDNFNKMIMKNINPYLKKNKESNNLPIIPLRKNRSEIFSMKNTNFRTKNKFKND